MRNCVGDGHFRVVRSETPVFAGSASSIHAGGSVGVDVTVAFGWPANSQTFEPVFVKQGPCPSLHGIAEIPLRLVTPASQQQALALTSASP